MRLARTDSKFSFGQALLSPNTAYRYEPVPSGVVHGTVTDKNDGEPIAGATVTASPGLGSTKTGPDGTYSLRLYPGRLHADSRCHELRLQGPAR